MSPTWTRKGAKLLSHTRFTPLLVAGCILLGLTAPLPAGAPSDAEQLWLQMINRLRSSPAEELDRLVNYRQAGTGLEWGDPRSDVPAVANAIEYFNVDPAVLRRQFQQLQPVPPLVWSEQLHDSAEYYSSLVINEDRQSHTLDDLNLLQRLQKQGGYDFSGGGTAGENLFAFSESVVHGHAGFVVDWGSTSTGIQDPPGHRDSLLNPQFREIGIAIAEDNDPSTQVGPLVVTQHLAADFNDGPFVTGVIYADQDEDDFYSIGEGFGGLAIELQQDGSDVALAASRTYRSGGFRLEISGLGAGTYRAVLKDPQPVFWSRPIVVSEASDNLAVDIQDPQFDIDSMSRLLRENRSWSPYDLNDDGRFTAADRAFLIEDVFRTFLGDSNLDGEFNSTDLVIVLRAGEYEDRIAGNSLWATGDWNGDGDFNTSDFIVALTAGAYENGPRAVAVPEPSTLALGLLFVVSACSYPGRGRARRAESGCGLRPQ